MTLYECRVYASHNILIFKHFVGAHYKHYGY